MGHGVPSRSADASRTRGRDWRILLVSVALLALVVSNVFPVAQVSSKGGFAELRLWECMQGSNARPRPLSLLLMATNIFLPASELTSMLYRLIKRRPGASGKWRNLLHLLDGLRPWSVILMYMMGMLVSISKMDSMTVVLPGAALVAMGVLIVLLAALLVIDTGDLRK